MNDPNRSRSAVDREQAERRETIQTALCVAQRCSQWLDDEARFQQELSTLLGKLSEQSPFANGSHAEISSHLLQLTCQHEELRYQQSHCRSAIGHLLDCAGEHVHLSALEKLIPDTEQLPLRERRLQLASLLETNRQQLRSVEIKLSFSNACITDLLNDLLGRPSSLAGYGADGRQSVTTHDSTLHAVS